MKSAWVLGASLVFLFTASDAMAKCWRVSYDPRVVGIRCGMPEQEKKWVNLQKKIKATVKDRVSDNGRHTTSKPPTRTDRITDTHHGERRVQPSR